VPPSQTAGFASLAHGWRGPWTGSPRLWRLCGIGLILVITTLALSPDPPPQIDTGWDKANHLLAFGALGWAAWGAVGPPPARAWPWATGVLVYGALIEVLQTLVPGRHGDAADLLADALGLALGWSGANVWASACKRLWRT